MRLKYINKMNKFIQEVIVTNDHLDDQMHVNNVQYLFWAQEIAKTHWTFLLNKTNKSFGVWVVRSHDIIYKSGAFLEDKIEISTFINIIKGPISERIVEFRNKINGKLLVRVCTKWCYLENLKNRKAVKVPVYIKNLFNPYLKVK